MRTLLKRRRAYAHAALLASAATSLPFADMPRASAHAIVGDRIFPATMAVDDPGVSDELDTQFNHQKTPADGGGNANINAFSYQWDKLITRDLALSVGGAYISQNAPNGGSAKGWDNLSIGLKYQLYANAAHEFLASVGVEADLGGTGSRAIGDNFSTITPTAYVGKGFGDLPTSLGWLRPFAVTAVVGPQLTTTTSDRGPNAFAWGTTVQYSMPYLKTQVKDLGLPDFVNHLVPVVEFPMQTTTSGGAAGHTTGTINPGVYWMNRYAQIGVEATIPVNRASGTHVGVLVGLHFFLDDLFPKTVGRPLF